MSQPTRKNSYKQPEAASKKKPPPRRKKTILAVLLMAVAVLVFLALVSYDAGDEASASVNVTDLHKVFTGDSVIKAKADTAHNWLGLVGAMIADFLVKSTIGYSVICVPLLMALFAWTMLRKGEWGKVFTLTNYVLVIAMLLSTTLGMARLVVGNGSLSMVWSGVVGDFLAISLAQLLGKVGGSLLLITGLFLAILMAVDLDLQKTIERLKSWSLMFMDWMGRKREEWQEAREAQREAQAIEEADRAKDEIRIKKAGDEESLEGEREEEPQELRRSPVVVQRDEPENESVEEIPGEVSSAEKPKPHSAKEIRFEVEKRKTEGEVNFDERPIQIGHEAADEEIDYVFPSVELLDPPRPGKEDVDDEELKANAELLRATLAQFDVELESVSVTPGPVVTLYELVPATGVKISRIVALENDIALKLAAKGIRIMAPIPGKSAVGVEIPNHKPSLVTIRSVINSTKFRDASAKLPLAMGKTIPGEVCTDDLTKMPHLLIAGATGSGKSVGINTILASLLFRMHPSEMKLVIIDPKKIELTQFAQLRNHFLARSPDVDEEIVTNPRNAVNILKSVEIEMEKRYDRLAHAGVRNLVDYNERVKTGRLKNTDTLTHKKMPYLLVVIDELADLMITAAKEVEEPIARLAQLARAVGIHLIVATQRPSVDVITGVIKANFPARIAYQVSSKTDSRTILDMNGADQLLGNGDMLYLASGTPKPIRLQNAYISPDEVDRLVDHIGKQKGYTKPFMLPSILEKKKNGGGADDGERDDLFDEAAHLIVRHQQGSVSLLQRRLKVGYSRAARLVDELEAAGIVGPFDGSKAREVLVESEDELEIILGEK